MTQERHGASAFGAVVAKATWRSRPSFLYSLNGSLRIKEDFGKHP